MEQQDIHDIYDIWYHPFWHKPWFIVLAALCTLLVAAFIGRWLYKKFKKAPILTSWQKAQLQLEQLHKDGFEDPQKFYTRLVLILKQYVQARYHMKAEAMTDDEFITHIAHASEFSDELQMGIKTICADIESIKFANHQVAVDRMKSSLQEALHFVNATVPRSVTS